MKERLSQKRKIARFNQISPIPFFTHHSNQKDFAEKKALATLLSITKARYTERESQLWNRRTTKETDEIIFVSGKAFPSEIQAQQELNSFKAMGISINYFMVTESMSQPGFYKIATKPGMLEEISKMGLTNSKTQNTSLFFKPPIENLEVKNFLSILQSITQFSYEKKYETAWNIRHDTNMEKFIFVSARAFPTQEEALKELEFFNQIGNNLFNVTESISQPGYYKIATTSDIVEQLRGKIHLLEKGNFENIEKEFYMPQEVGDYCINDKVLIKKVEFESISMGDYISPMYRSVKKACFISKEEFDKFIDEKNPNFTQ